MQLEFRLLPPGLPCVAERAPDRGCFVDDVGGHLEVFAWDLPAGTSRQVTDRPATGTTTADLDPLGQTVWWFEDGVDGVGRWMLQPWTGGPDVEALPGVAAGEHAGTAAALDGTTAVALARCTGRASSAAGTGPGDDDQVVTVYLRDPRGRVREVTRGPGLRLVDLSPGGDLLATTHVHDPGTVRLLDAGGSTVAELPGAGLPVAELPVAELPGAEPATGALPGCRALWPVGFRPTPGEPLLLLVAECPGGPDPGYRLATWTRHAGVTALPGARFETEIVPAWCPDGRILVRQDRRTRSELLLLDPVTARRERIGPSSGTVLDQRGQPDGDVHYLWTDARTAPVLRTTSGRRPPAARALGQDQASTGGQLLRELRELWVPGPGGPVHTLVTLPESRQGPWPAVFLLHGGPHRRDTDAYDPTVVVLAAAGLAVVRLNYRGSTGYGVAWRHAADRSAGPRQVEDLLAVRDAVIRDGTVDPDRTAVAGRSWGGYLALLALGTAPDRWRAGAAVQPIADYAAAYRAASPEVRGLDRRLLGGTPWQVPAEYARCSPLTYAPAVRAPVLLVAAQQDRKCPPQQVRDYARAVRATGTEVSVLEVPGGHDAHSPDAEGRILASLVTFLARHVGARATAASDRPASD